MFGREFLELIIGQNGQTLIPVAVAAMSFLEKLVAHTGLEPVISALRGQRVNQLHQCALFKNSV